MKVLVIGGNLFFGLKLINILLAENHMVTVLNRGNLKPQYQGQVETIICDRKAQKLLEEKTKNRFWDVIFDQACYDYHEAKAACEVFKKKTNHYIFTSSQSVYGYGENISEKEFDPKNHKIKSYENVDSNYGEAKRQAEVGFVENAIFETTFVRFPIVLGKDDYTKRMLFHINKIKNQEEIFFNNIEAKIGFISSDCAAEVLLFLANNKITGPINCCFSGHIQLSKLVEIIEKNVGEKLVKAKNQTDQNQSPYGIEEDWFMSNQKLIDQGFQIPDIRNEIESIIKSLL